MNSRDDIFAFFRDLLLSRYRGHRASGLSDADARREALRDIEEWTKAIDEGFLEFVEWIPAEHERAPVGDSQQPTPGEQLTLV